MPFYHKPRPQNAYTLLKCFCSFVRNPNSCFRPTRKCLQKSEYWICRAEVPFSLRPGGERIICVFLCQLALMVPCVRIISKRQLSSKSPKQKRNPQSPFAHNEVEGSDTEGRNGVHILTRHEKCRHKFHKRCNVSPNSNLPSSISGEAIGMFFGPVLPRMRWWCPRRGFPRRQELLKSRANNRMIWAKKYQY